MNAVSGDGLRRGDGGYHVIKNSDIACLGRSSRFQELDPAH